MTEQILSEIIDPDRIERLRPRAGEFDRARFREILEKAEGLAGLSLEEAAFLLSVDTPEDRQTLRATAIRVKEAVYGPRLVLFAPLYTSSFCANECLYCGFRTDLRTPRRRLTREEILREAEAIIAMGHKRILLVAGEDAATGPAEIAGQMQAIYSVRHERGNIRRINVNAAPMDVAGFRAIKEAGIGTYQCFQETYHRETYAQMHRRGPKSDYANRIGVFQRCIEGGIDDFGMGFLFGLYDYRFELLALLQHIAFLEKTCGLGPHTISIPRLEAAEGTEIHEISPWLISDADLAKATAILRLTVPYTGIILSTRESAEMRRELLRVGVSQMSAGSITNPGGYSQSQEAASQFAVADHRSLDEVIRQVCGEHYVPSFCTGCYRHGRTGGKFQELARHQQIDPFCSLNAVATLQEYLEDHASAETRTVGERCLGEFIAGQTDGELREKMEAWRARIKRGERDIPF